jgi:ADP-ribosylglycohydrolase
MSNLKNAVRAAFSADAVVLPVHWVYDETKIASFVTGGTLDSILEPNKLNEYHESKKRGDFTHYGDQEIVLLESVKETGKFAALDWSEKWHQLYATSTGNKGYRDGATKTTIESGKASKSGDLSGAARFAPVLLIKDATEDTVAAAAKDQAALTHNQPQVLASADFFARLAWRLANTTGDSIETTLTSLLPTVNDDETKKLIQAGIDAAKSGKSDEEAIRSLGEKKTFGPPDHPVTVYTAKACDYSGSIPSTVYFLVKYSNTTTEEAISASAMVGGDNCARGLLIGTIFGAAGKGVPSYYDQVNAKAKIEALLA